MANTKVSSEQIIDDVALGGNPTTTTQSASDNSTKVATTAYVTTAVSNLVDSAPSSLNTLNELAAAMNDNASFFSTVLPLSGGTMTGGLVLGGTTPTLTIGDAGAEDTKIVFDGNAQDYYIALDDSADTLIIGNGSTVGSSPAITINSSQNSTFAGTISSGAITSTGIITATNFEFSGTAGKIHYGGSADTGDYLGLADVSSGSNILELYQDSGLKFGIDGVTGDTTFNADNFIIQSANATDPQFRIKNTNADGQAPQLILQKDSASPADGDEVGRIYFLGDDDAGNATEAFLAVGRMTDVSDGAEDSNITMYTYKAGAQKATLHLNEGAVSIGATTSAQAPLHVFNPSGGDATDKAGMLSEAIMKLQPHASNSTNMLFAQVDGGSSMGIQVTNGPATANWDLSLSPFGGKVGIGEVDPAASLHINTSTNSPLLVESTHGDGGYIELQLSDSGGAGSLTGYIGDSQAIVSGGDAGDLAIRAQGDFVVSTGGNSQRFQINSSGSAIFSQDDSTVTISDAGTNAATVKASANDELYVGGDDNDGYFRIKTDGNTQVKSPSNFWVNLADSDRYGFDSVRIYPGATNTYDLGISSHRWREVFGVTSNFSSDARLKTELTPLTDNEIKASKLLAKEIGTYKWLDQVASEGDKAKINIGLTAQKIIEVMKSCSLDALDYKLVTFSEWDATEAKTEKRMGEDGKVEEYTVPATPKGDEYGVCYEQLNQFIAAGFNARLEALEG